jgi:transposase
VLFQDEARFGRINNRHRRCWAPIWERPVVAQQAIREFIYALAVACPQDGNFSSLIMPQVDTEVMSIFLAHVASEFQGVHCLIFLDQAGWHVTGKLRVPNSITLIPLPPYSPELNPIEPVWAHLRENYFGNLYLDSLDKVENTLCSGLYDLSNNKELVSSITSFDWLKTINLTSN